MIVNAASIAVSFALATFAFWSVFRTAPHKSPLEPIVGALTLAGFMFGLGLYLAHWIHVDERNYEAARIKADREYAERIDGEKAALAERYREVDYKRAMSVKQGDHNSQMVLRQIPSVQIWMKGPDAQPAQPAAPAIPAPPKERAL